MEIMALEGTRLQVETEDMREDMELEDEEDANATCAHQADSLLASKIQLKQPLLKETVVKLKIISLSAPTEPYISTYCISCDLYVYPIPNGLYLLQL